MKPKANCHIDAISMKIIKMSKKYINCSTAYNYLFLYHCIVNSQYYILFEFYINIILWLLCTYQSESCPQAYDRGPSDNHSDIRNDINIDLLGGDSESES